MQEQQPAYDSNALFGKTITLNLDQITRSHPTVACVASVSVLFPSKDCAKNGTSKRGGGGEGRKETLADKPRDFENRPHRLSCLSARTDI